MILFIFKMILNLTAADELQISLDGKFGPQTKLKLILLELPPVGLYSTCTVALPVKTTLVKLNQCSIDTSSSVGSDGTFIAPVSGVYKAVYNGKISFWSSSPLSYCQE